MKTFITSLLFTCSALVTLSGCATAEERAARAAEQALKVKTALTQRRYKIDVNRMYPMNGNSRNVSYGYSVEVRNDTLISYLPYFGRAYNVPYGGGKGLNFSERIGSYHETQQSNGARLINIELKNDEDIYPRTSINTPSRSSTTATPPSTSSPASAIPSPTPAKWSSGNLNKNN